MISLAAKKPLSDLIEEFDCEQRSDDWYAMRIGVCTASNFSAIMASGIDGGDSKSRKRLLNRMAAELIFGRPMETFSNAAMERGLEMEPAALENYAFTRGVEVRRVGFVRRTIRNPLYGDLVVGCSPDGLIGTDGIVQTKSMQPDLIVSLVDSGRSPGEYRAQCQGEMWVTGRKWNDLRIGYEGFPITPTFRMERDEAYIKLIANEVEKFDYDLKQLVARVRDKGKAHD